MLIQTIQNDMKQAMRNKEKEKLSTLRMLLATLEKQKVEKKLTNVTDLSDADVISAIGKNVKQLDQEIDSILKVDRDASKQLAEKELLSTYLPKQLSEEEIKLSVAGILFSVKQTGGNIGTAMKFATASLKGKADMKKVSELIKEGMK